jgi:chromate transporter
MRPVVVALIAVPVITTMRAIGLTVVTGFIAASSAMLIWLFGVSPVWVILAAGLGGYLWYRFDKYRNRRKGL